MSLKVTLLALGIHKYEINIPFLSVCPFVSGLKKKSSEFFFLLLTSHLIFLRRLVSSQSSLLCSLWQFIYARLFRALVDSAGKMQIYVYFWKKRWAKNSQPYETQTHRHSRTFSAGFYNCWCFDEQGPASSIRLCQIITHTHTHTPTHTHTHSSSW